ncbi:MAG: uracil-DNA glycosylase [Myxococcota bacterium]
MTDPRQELSEIAAGIRAVLELQQALGHRVEPTSGTPQDASAPPAQTAEPVVEKDLSNLAHGDVAAVRQVLGDCQRCGLCAGRSQIVFGVGDPRARLLVIGEAPAFQEDRAGEPFVDEGGQMLDLMLTRVLGLQRSEVYLTSVVKCRPPDNRAPTVDELRACRPFLEAQIAAVQPAVILIMGNMAFKALFNEKIGISSARGQWRTWAGIPVMPTFHPRYLLRKPSAKRLSFSGHDDHRALHAAPTRR